MGPPASLPKATSGCRLPPTTNDPSFAELKQAIITRTGHHYYADKDHLLRDRLDRRLRATGCRDLRAYLSLLRQPTAGKTEWQELESEITICETFFFRHAEQFDALRSVILPALITKKQNTRRLRIWSAGCAVGAEPYSLAILLERMLGAAMGDWTVEIVGSDINHQVLAQARDGLFTDWALRGMPEAERKRDFSPTVDRMHWRIADRHRVRVRFVQHNLISVMDGGQTGEWSGFDLVLCRNVLIYFSPERIPPIMSALARCLAPWGWLMVGHSDAIVSLPKDLTVVELSGTMVFRPPSCLKQSVRPRAAPADYVPPVFPPVAPPLQAPQVQKPMPGPRMTPPITAPAPASPPRRSAPVPSLAAIRALADAGHLQEAAKACAAAIEADALDPRLHFYDGVIAQAAGQKTRAEAALRRAVYLNGTMVMAHYHLGLLLLDSATPEAGRRSMAQVLKLCAGLPEGDVLPESDGLTPRDLAERVSLRLRPRRR